MKEVVQRTNNLQVSIWCSLTGSCLFFTVSFGGSCPKSAAALTRLSVSGVRGAELEETQKQIKTGSACVPCAQPAVVHSYLTSSHKQTQGSVCIRISKHMNISKELRVSLRGTKMYTVTPNLKSFFKSKGIKPK